MPKYAQQLVSVQQGRKVRTTSSVARRLRTKPFWLRKLRDIAAGAMKTWGATGATPAARDGCSLRSDSISRGAK